MTEIDFAGIVDHSTLDYPGRVSAVVYLCGCPFRCPWCQNAELVSGGGDCSRVDISFILDRLKENFLVQAVCVSGGEPLMQAETVELLGRVKSETDLLLGIDTNGYFPERLEEALPFLDFVALDVKAPLDERYGRVVGLPEKWGEIVDRVRMSLRILGRWKRRKEARTTIVPGLIDKGEEIADIAGIVSGAGFTQYTLQQFRADRTLDPGYERVQIPSLELMQGLGRAAKKYLPNTVVQIVTLQNGFEEVFLG